jgi:hypothetical protein
MEGVLNDEMSRMLANSIDHYQSIQHQEKLNLIVSEQELLFVKTYGLIPFKDGNSWCVLLGKDITTGICGFGETPLKAILDFNKNFVAPKREVGV